MIVRKDLPFPVQAVQTSHAVLESSNNFPDYFKNIPHPYLVLTSVKSELQLLNWAKKLKDAGIKFSLWKEPDLRNETTSLATIPVYGETRFIFKNLQLLK